MEGAAAAVAADTPSSRRARPAAPVRVVATICPGGAGSVRVAARAADASSAVVSLHEDAASGAPTPRRDAPDHRLDACYSLIGAGAGDVFRAEVEPLVDAAVLRGANSCVVACGATAKTHLLIGTQDQPGLLTMAMAQILRLSEHTRAVVRVSSYQVVQDNHVFDLIEPKDNEVLVLEDGHGRTNLKGLSKVHVSSIEEFVNLCVRTKPSAQSHHHGFIIYISRFDQQGKEGATAKINFIDLAGYTDPKHKNNAGGLAPTNCNKSMYALMNVVQALNSNQSFVAYRQSKLTRILQESLCKTNGAVLIACLDEVSNKDVVSTISLVSRSSQVVNKQCHDISMGTRSTSKSNVNLSVSVKNLSRSLLSSTHQPSSVQDKNGRPQFNSSTVTASRIPTANKRSEVMMHSAKKPSSISASVNMKKTVSASVNVKKTGLKPGAVSASNNMKKTGLKPALSGRKLFVAGTISSKEDKIVSAATKVTKAEEVQSLLGMETQAPLPIEECDETETVVDVVSSELQPVVPCSMQELISSSMEAQVPLPAEGCDTEKVIHVVASEMQKEVPGIMQELISNSMQEEDYCSSDLHSDHSCTNLAETCSFDISDELVEKTPVVTTQSSPKLSDQLREISNTLKLLSAQPVSIIEQKTDAVRDRQFRVDSPEPRTPAVHLRCGHAENSHDFHKTRSTGVQRSVAQECLSFLNSANKEQLKTLKYIGEKRANFILELREESPELFKEVDDLKTIIGMNKKEIKGMMSGMFLDS